MAYLTLTLNLPDEAAAYLATLPSTERDRLVARALMASLIDDTDEANANYHPDSLALLSQVALAADWDTPYEDAAWLHLQLPQ